MENNFCKVCGSELKAGERFCSNCGTAINYGAAPVYQQPTYQQPAAVQQYTVEQPKRTTAFKGLYIPAKILGVVSLIDSISDIILALCILVMTSLMPRLYYDDAISAYSTTFAVTYVIIVALITSIMALIMSIISICLGNKIKRNDPNDPGVNVARPARVALVFSIISLVMILICFVAFVTHIRIF